VDASTPTKAILIDRATARVEAEHGPGAVPAPCSTVAYEVLGELMRGKGFGGSAKWRRSIATRPTGVYGRLRAAGTRRLPAPISTVVGHRSGRNADPIGRRMNSCRPLLPHTGRCTR
jgi:hypothetical protein